MTARPVEANDVNCDDCNGACCRDIGGPPGYMELLAPIMRWDTTEHETLRIKWRFENLQRWGRIPEAARAELVEYANWLADHGEQAEGRCVWLGQDNRCRWYEHRPAMCRAYKPGSQGCLSCRREYYELQLPSSRASA